MRREQGASAAEVKNISPYLVDGGNTVLTNRARPMCDVPPAELRKLPGCLKRVEAVRALRLASKSAPTRKLGETPTRFHVESFPEERFLVIPGVSSVERAAQAVLVERAKHPLATLADLYDPRTMPADLVDVHAALDRAVDRCYRSAPFTSDRQRVEYLFALYERYANPLLPREAKARR